MPGSQGAQDTLTLGGLQDVHRLPDLQWEVMLAGAREVPHG